MPRFKYLFAAIVATALIVRIVVVIGTPHYQARTDAEDFDQIAVSLADHNRFPDLREWAPSGPTALRPPLFGVVLAGVYKIVGTSSKHTRWTAGRVIEALLGTIAVALLCLIGLRLFGPVVGLVAGAIAAVDPPLVLVGSSLLSESLFIPLLLGSVLAALMHRDSAHRWRWAVLCGFLLGLAALTRGNGFVLAIPLAFLLWTERPRRQWRALRAPAAMLAAAIVTVMPWTIRNIIDFHRLVPLTTEGGYALAGVYNAATQSRHGFEAVWFPPIEQMRNIAREHPHANEAEMSSRLTSNALHYIVHHPASLLKTSFLSAKRLLNIESPVLEEVFSYGEGYPLKLAKWSVYVFWPILALALFGAFLPARRRAPWSFWAIPLLMLLSAVFLEGLTRYRSPADPFFVLLASLTLVWLADRIRAPGSVLPARFQRHGEPRAAR